MRANYKTYNYFDDDSFEKRFKRKYKKWTFSELHFLYKKLLLRYEKYRNNKYSIIDRIIDETFCR